MRKDTLPIAHFRDLYAVRPDPWHLADSGYERLKHAATLAALPRPRYRSGFEIGCATGVFTDGLADRCDSLLAAEPVDAALDQARQRLAAKPWVSFAPLFVPGEWPERRFDLVVISEVIDYLGAEDVERLARKTVASLDRGGDVVLVHWVGKKRGPPSGDEASDRFSATPGFRVLSAERNGDYRLDLLRKSD